MSERSDAELLNAVARSDRDAYSELYDRYLAVSFNLALHVTGSRALADEAVQEGMLRVWKSANLFKAENARAWILSIVAREGIRILKAKRREQRQKEAGIQREQIATREAPQDSEHAELIDALRGVVRELPELERQLIALHYGAGLSQHQIAAALELPQQTISFRIRKALEVLRGDLAKAGFAAAIPVLGAENIGRALCSGEAIPAGLKERTLVQLEKLGTQAARQMSRRAGAIKTGSVAPLAAGVTALLITAGLGWTYLHTSAPNMSAAPNAIEKVAAPLIRKWDFNTDAQSNDFQVVQGGWHRIPTGGPDGSGCMESEGLDTGIQVHRPLPEFPFRVRLKSAMINMSRDFKDGGHVMLLWSKWRALGLFHNISTMHSYPKNQWTGVSYYVTEKCIYSVWDSDGSIYQVVVVTPEDAAELHVGISQQYRLDDLIIEKITPAEVPDCSEFLRAYESIEPAKRVGTVPVPGLKSARPPEPVSIEFFSPFDDRTGKGAIR